MPLLIEVPANAQVITEWGSYPHRLNVLSRKDTAIQRQLRRGGLTSYEPTTQAALLTLMQHAPLGAVFFDVGAHIGLYSALIAAVFANKGVRVVAFEPTPSTAETARRLRRFNDLDFEIVEMALSCRSGKATLYVSDIAETSNSLNPDHRRNHLDGLTVDVGTLDEYAAENGIDPDVLKIDVETNEPEVLAGGLETIKRARPAIVCEILGESGAQAIEHYVRQLETLGYRTYPLTRSLPWKAMSVHDIGRLPGNGDVRDWLFSPQPVTRRFARDVRAWTTAIERCDETTNLLVPAGQAPPRDWNAWHAVPPRVPAPRRWLRSLQSPLR